VVDVYYMYRLAAMRTEEREEEGEGEGGAQRGISKLFLVLLV